MTVSRAAALLVAALAASVPPPCAWAAQDPRVTAQDGVAIVGPVSNSTITNTVNQENPATLAMLAKALSDKDASEEKRREAETKAAELGTKWGFTSAAVAETFRILGEQNVPDERAPARLIEIATHYAQTRETLAALEPDDPHAAELARQAKQALDQGHLAEADALLDRAKDAELAGFRQARELKQKAQEAEDRHALNAAKLLAGKGDIALTQLRYAVAADQFKQAAELVPPGHADETIGYRHRQADALYREGDEHGDNAALKAAIETLHLVLQQRPRERVPLEWAATQMSIGNALTTLGDRERGTARLEEAVAAFRAALEEWTRGRVPLQWAGTQANLGNALAQLGRREPGTARLKEAIAAWQTCLTVAASAWPQPWVREVRHNVNQAKVEIARRAPERPSGLAGSAIPSRHKRGTFR